jgi:hypothetical protein
LSRILSFSIKKVEDYENRGYAILFAIPSTRKTMKATTTSYPHDPLLTVDEHFVKCSILQTKKLVNQ